MASNQFFEYENLPEGMVNQNNEDSGTDLIIEKARHLKNPERIVDNENRIVIGGISRMAITGGPKTGKTRMTDPLKKIPVFKFLHTDDLIHLGWSEASQEAANWLDENPKNVCIEGVAVPRALRKWLDMHPEGRPVDLIIYLEGPPWEEPTPGQSSMAKGVRTVFDEIRPELEARGVIVQVISRVAGGMLK